MWRTFLLSLWLVRSGPNLFGCYFITMCDGPGEEYDKSETIQTSTFYFELISQHFPMGFVGLYCKRAQIYALILMSEICKEKKLNWYFL